MNQSQCFIESKPVVTGDVGNNSSLQTHDQELTQKEDSYSRKDYSSANFTDVQRNWIFGFICMARGELGLQIDEMNNELCHRTRELISENSQLTSGRIPSNNMVKSLWYNFLNTGRISKKRAGGRKKKNKTVEDVKL